MPGGISYNATKWAFRGMTKCAALDVAGSNVRVDSVHPGSIRTPMVDGLTEAMVETQPIARPGRSDEVRRVVLFVASDDASYCTGTEFVVDGGYSTGIASMRNT